VPTFIAPRATTATAETLLHYSYISGKDYYAPTNAVPNGVYAETGPHPSDRVVASLGNEDSYSYPEEIKTSKYFRRDSSFPISQMPGTSTDGEGMMYVHATPDYDASFIGDSTQSHHYGYATCENIGACFDTDFVGSKCYSEQMAGTSRSYNYLVGACYESATGSLQCGRTLEVDSRFASAPLPLTQPAGADIPPRCPAGTALEYQGKMTVKRLLIGGCMIPSDSRYKISAEIHIPDDCDDVADYKKGCLFPGSVNYSPGSVQSGDCIYKLNGCTSATALNYNSLATDNDGSCIEPVTGCTLDEDPYDGVADDTPGYESRFVGTPVVNGGIYEFDSYKNVLNSDASANVLSGCIVAIEGCMDSTAVNYNSNANVNSVTWCVAPVTGCMMPSSFATTVIVEGTALRPHTKDGVALFFNPEATVNDVSLCGMARYGCTNNTALNYDEYATIDDGSCYEAQLGCLDPTALNFNCTFQVPPYAVCTDANPRPTVHETGVCVYEVFPPPPPTPGVPPGTEVISVVELSFTATGDVADFTEDVIDSMAETFAAEAGVDADAVEIIIESASVKITVKITADSATAADSITDTLSATMADQESATSFLSDFGITVLSVPVIAVVEIAILNPPSPPPDVEMDMGGLIGGIAGGVGGFLMLIGIIAGATKGKGKKTQTTYPA
jgi:hypothetical protein